MPNTVEVINKAKAAKNDEFYTLYEDVEKELEHYIKANKNLFKNKTVLLPCDDPDKSNFTKYFENNFNRLGLRKVISTSYNKNGKGKLATITKQGKSKTTLLKGNGDFRSEEIKTFRDEADFIITNPPFSLWRDFFQFINPDEKHFLILGTLMAIGYSKISPYIVERKLWLGLSKKSGDMFFEMSEKNVDLKQVKEIRQKPNGKKQYITRVPAIRWYTNIPHNYVPPKLVLKTMAENKANNIVYDKYDNYDAIEVSFVKNIPSDYKGKMGVPISFFDKYNPNQFEVLEIKDNNFINGKAKFKRVIIKHKGGQ
jgi:hypothetical protein